MPLEQAVVMFVLMLVAQVPLLVAAVVNWIKSRSTEKKLDENTRLTVAGTSAAASTAVIAASAAEDAKRATENISDKINGDLDNRIEKAVGPLRKMVEELTVEIRDIGRRI
jgi:hypothetical protein